MKTRVVLVLAALASGCAGRSTSTSAPAPLPQDGPASELFFAQMNSRTSSGATLKFALADSAYALVGQVRDGKIRVIFPAMAEGTGWMRARDTMSVLLEYNSSGPIFLITRKKPIDFRLSGVGPYWADIGLEEYAGTKDPIEGIRWYAAQVADTNYRVEVADIAPSFDAMKGSPSGPRPRMHPWGDVGTRGCVETPPRTTGSGPRPIPCPRP